MDEEYADRLLGQIFKQAKAQFGGAIKGHWFHGGEFCPACNGQIDEMDFKGEKALSLNVFIYRERGILIGYLLCGRCAKRIFQDAEKAPGQQTEVHTMTEMNLVASYQNYLRSLDA